MGTVRAAAGAVQRTFAWPLATLRQGLLHDLSTLEIFLGGFGLIAALVTAALLAVPLGTLPGAAGDFTAVGVAILLAPVGIGVALSRRAEVERIIHSIRERSDAVAGAGFGARGPAARDARPTAVVVDTSAIIDGRLADVAESGFLLADLIIPRFVLDELRRVADSSDALKRQRGRYGLEMLSRIQASGRVHTVIDDAQYAELPDVDAKVLALARVRNAALLTNDYNLNRVAGVEDVPVLNLNALAQAMRNVALPGESLHLRILQEGREREQGVGFLQDGTMVVVEDARRLLEQDVTVEITRTIQTTAGRMLFARLRQAAPAPAAEVEPERTQATP